MEVIICDSVLSKKNNQIGFLKKPKPV